MGSNGRTPDFRFHLDTPEAQWLRGDEYYLAGWFFPVKDASSTLILEVDGNDQLVEPGLSRPDVVHDQAAPEARYSGFCVKFRHPKLSATVNLKVTRGNEISSVVATAPVPPLPVWRNERAASYAEWVETREPRHFWPSDEVSEHMAGLAFRPRIHLVVDLGNSDGYFARETIRSIVGQLYQNWTATVLGFPLLEKRTAALLEKATAEDPRIRLRSDVGPSSFTAFNSVLASSDDDCLALIRAHDELSPFALVEIARYLNEQPWAELVYTDYDRIDRYGRRLSPYFKPDFDWQIFRSFDYLSRFAAVRPNLVRQVGGLRDIGASHDLTAAVEWDFLLRVAEQVGCDRVCHIPKILYHRRTAGAGTEESPSGDARQRRMLLSVASEHSAVRGETAEIEPGWMFPLIRYTPRFSSEASVAIFARCEDGMFQQSTIALNLKPGKVSAYEFVGCLLYRDHSELGRTLIRDFSEIKEDVLVFVHGPLETISHCFCQEMLAQARRTDCGLVSGICIDTDTRVISTGFVRDEDGTLIDQYRGLLFSELPRFPHLMTVRTVEAVSPQFFAVKREALEQIGDLRMLAGLPTPQLVANLARHAHDRGLRVLVTPFAVATFENSAVPDPDEAYASAAPQPIRANPNLAEFEDASAIAGSFPAEL